MQIQKLYSYLRRAIQDYDMIQPDDHIAIGISGGKDSLTLLHGLCGLQKFYPIPFRLTAITVDLGYEEFDLQDISSLCQTLGVNYHVVSTQIKDMITTGECSLCARLRKGAFNQKALELGCNKIAYAHSLDDVVETMMMSLIYEGRFCSFWPVTDFDDSHLSVIRPMIYISNAEIIGFRNKYDLPVTKNPCPYDGATQRSYIRNLIKEIDHHAPGVRKRMMTAIQNGDPVWKLTHPEIPYTHQKD